MERNRVSLAKRSSSSAPRTAALLAHVAQIAAAFAILDRSSASTGRIGLLAFFAGMFGVRAVHRATRGAGPLSWADAAFTAVVSGTYQITFAWLGSRSSASVGSIEAFAVALYVSGGMLSTAAEAIRDEFRSRPEGAARLCTLGPFALVRYPRYLGDFACASAWALVTRSTLAWTVIAVHAAVVVLVYVPALDRRLSTRHGAEWRAWASRTKRIVPLVY